METSLVLVKPDGVQRGLVGRVLSRFEDKGLSIAGLKLLVAPKATLEKHYAVHRERPFYGELVEFMSSGPAVALALEADNAVLAWREAIGATDDPGLKAFLARKYGNPDWARPRPPLRPLDDALADGLVAVLGAIGFPVP